MKLDEQDLTEAMREAVGEARPDMRALVVGATRKGRRLRGRRWTVAGGSAVGAVAMVAGASLFGAYLPTVAPGDADTYTLPGTSVGTTDEVVFPTYPMNDRDEQIPPGKAALNGQATVSILKDLLPAGTGGTSGYEGQSAQENVHISSLGTLGRLLVDAGLSGAEVHVNISRGFGRDMQVEGALEDFYSCEGDRAEGELTHCGVGNLPDGSVLMVYEDRSGLLIRRHADLLRPDGLRIFVSTSNGSDTENGPIVAPSPPLSLDELQDIARSPRWEPFVDPSVLEEAKDVEPFEDLTFNEGATPETTPPDNSGKGFQR